MKAKVQEGFAKRWTGCVEIKTGNNSAVITSIDTTKDGKTKQFPNGSATMKVLLSDFPKLSNRLIKPNMSASKKFRVRLNEDGDAVETVTPYSGVYRARATGLGPKTQEGEYRLIHKVYNEGTEKENHHDEFLCVYEITDGAYRGVELPAYFLHYKFEAVPEGDEDEGFTQFNTADTPQASQLHKLQNWAETHGNILDAPVRWQEDGTILEELEERILDNDREVNLVFEKGYIKLVQPVEDEEVEDDSSVEGAEADTDEELPGFLQEPVEEKPAKVTKKSPAAKKLKQRVPAEDDEL